MQGFGLRESWGLEVSGLGFGLRESWGLEVLGSGFRV